MNETMQQPLTKNILQGSGPPDLNAYEQAGGYQALPTVYAQNSSLEIAWRRVLDGEPSIAGERVAPFFTEGWEGFSIDYPGDFERAEASASSLPVVSVEPHPEAAAR